MKRFVACLAVSALVAAAGCGGSGSIPISGQVTYKGEPLKAVNVVFVGATADQTANATTDDQGNFSGVSAAPGDYKIAVTAPSPPPAADGSISYAMVAPPFPTRYASIEESGLTAKVESGGENNFKFQLTE
jgi:hypothetical protein